MDREKIKQEIQRHFIEPTENSGSGEYIGVEIEIPIVNLKGEATDQGLAQRVFGDFIKDHGFEPEKYDDNGVCYSATSPEIKDNVSFDCSYNNLEFSFARERSINEISERFNEYIKYFNDRLSQEGHLLTGMGINPHYRINDSKFIPSERYRMLERYLSKAETWDYPMYFHPYVTYGTFASASQVQLDVKKESLVDTLNTFTLLEPIKAVLFSNSTLEEEPELYCVRDLLWENSTHGINPHNVGMYDYPFKSIDDFAEYLSSASLFNVERNGKSILFKPIPATDYFSEDELKGEIFEDGAFRPVSFTPEIDDIRYLRTYNYQDLTYRGTIEFRSCCTQPFSEAMTVAAFHLGLINELEELKDLLSNDKVLYQRGHSPSELRKAFNRKQWPDFVSRKDLEVLIVKVLDLAKYGLMERGLGEERFLEPLYERARRLESPARRNERLRGEGLTLREVIEENARLD